MAVNAITRRIRTMRMAITRRMLEAQLKRTVRQAAAARSRYETARAEIESSRPGKARRRKLESLRQDALHESMRSLDMADEMRRTLECL